MRSTYWSNAACDASWLFLCLLRERRERGAECEVFGGSSCSALRLVSWQACFWQEVRGNLHRRRRRSAVRTFGTFLNARLCVHTTLACRGIWTAPRPGCWKLLNYFSIARFFCCSSRAVGLLLSVRVMSHAFVQVVVVVVVLLCFFLNFYFGANRAVLLTTFKRCSFVFFFFLPPVLLAFHCFFLCEWRLVLS